MDRQGFLDAITNIGTCEDDVERRTLLTQLSDEVVKDYDTLTQLTETNKDLTAKNETLRDANMQLFLRVGGSKDNDDEEHEEPDRRKKETRLKFEDLFDEKGGIK